MTAAQSQTAARELLHVVMLVMKTLGAEMRRSRRPLAPAQMGSLMRIGAGSCSMSELARHQAVSLPTISKSVEMLVRRGWVERSAGEADRRQTVVTLAAGGCQILDECRRDAEEFLAGKLATLSPEERDDAKAGLRLVKRALDMR